MSHSPFLKENHQLMEEQVLDQNKVLTIANTLDIHNTTSIITFGSEAQNKLSEITNKMLADVKTKDAGTAGTLLSDMVYELKGFQSKEKKLREEPNFFQKLLGGKKKIFKQFISQFETVSEHIDQISNGLEEKKQVLLVDITSLDHLYQATLNYYHELGYFIAAIQLKLNELDQKIIPELQTKAQASDKLLEAQHLRDIQNQKNELERRLHDLKLTKQVTMQALPSIRLVQENDKGLVNKINSTLSNTVPLWRQQLAQSIAIFRSSDTAEAIKKSNDLTNELLINNAETLKIANSESRKQIERNVFDIESVEKANQLLIDTIEEGIEINQSAQAQRKEAEKKLIDAENALKSALISVSKHTIN